MDRSKARKFVATACAVGVVGVAIALAAPSIGEAPPAVTTPGSCLEFARDVDPKKVAVDSGYDAERNIVYAHEGGRTYVLRPDDPACASFAGPRSVIDDAVRTARENEALTCRQLAEALAQGRSEVQGRRLDRDGAGRYVAERCGGGQ